MPVVVDFNGRIDSKKQWDFDRSAVNAVNGQRHLLLRLQFRIESIQIETFFAGKPKRLRAMLCCELQRQYAHADGMGVLPLQFTTEHSAQTLGLTGEESFDLDGLDAELKPQQQVTLTIHRVDGASVKVPLLLRIDTPIEI